MKEIGGEFYSSEIKIDGINRIINEDKFMLSGRTALDYIIRDIKLDHEDVKYAILPSYCCDSMIEPFIRNNLEIEFYEIYLNENGCLDVDTSMISELRGKNILLCMDYFGYNHNLAETVFSKLGATAITIEDRTHSFFSYDNECECDYSFASLRKWSRFGGLGICNKRKNIFHNITLKDSLWKGCELREEAAELKKDISTLAMVISYFLELFNEAELYMDEDYILYPASQEDIYRYELLDHEQIVECRIRNAQILIDGLSSISAVNVLYDRIEKGDCPMFVPVTLETNIRDLLQKHLILHDIFCPTHWPLTDAHKNISTRAKLIYQSELSLVCDQRYDSNDMERIVETIEKFFRKLRI